jgi:hypothetical protein
MDKLERVLYVSVGRGGHTIHYLPETTTHSYVDGTGKEQTFQSTSERRLEGYESGDGPTVQAAIRCEIPVIDTTTVEDAYELVGLPMVALTDDRVAAKPWHGMSYVPLAFYAGLARAMGATVYNLALDRSQAEADLAAWRQARAERRAKYEAEKAAEQEKPIPEFRFPDKLNMPRHDGSKRTIHKPGELCAKLAESEGFDSFGALVDHYTCDSVSPGICWLCQSYTTEVEPDQREGYCENCGEGSVISAIELALAAD